MMKVVLLFSKSNKSKPPMVPPIPLVKDEEKAYSKVSYTSLNLRSTPADENSPIYGIQMPYFKSGTCEQSLEFIDKVQLVFIRQNLTTGPQKVAFMRTSLKGDAYTYFIWYFVMVGNEDNAMFVLASQALMSHISPSVLAYAKKVDAPLHA